jgi:adenosine deaminase
MFKMMERSCYGVMLAALLLSPLPLRGQTSSGEKSAEAAFARVSSSPLELRVFLEQMPKGGDLHFHLGGAVYAETILKDAAEDNLCINPATHSLAPNSGLTKVPPLQPLCADGLVPAANVFRDQKFYDDMVDAWSMRSFVPSTGVSGHDHFFSTPSRAGTSKRHQGEWLDEVATRAAAQNEQYLEIMTATSYDTALQAATALGWDQNMASLRDALLAKGLRNDVSVGRAELDAIEATRNQREHCGTPQATPACAILVRYLYTVSRGNLPQRVFAQALLAFELASADPRVVGINFAQPEDGYLAMSEYHRQMLMLDYLHSVYPKVHISLHAGELAFGMVPPEGLKFHIQEAVDLGHAERIGHGIDVMYEKNAHALLKEMAEKHVMVEINLTSNDVILGITGKQHPVTAYLAAHVPIALSTDDEGVSRIDLTHEYVRAVEEFGLGYLDLKRSARTSIEHSFLPGTDLWAVEDSFTTVNAACAIPLSGECRDFLTKSEKAQQQWNLEQRFTIFETNLGQANGR